MFPGLIISGSRWPVPGIEVVTWLDDPKRAPPTRKVTAPRKPPTAIVLHTSRGVVGGVREGSRVSTQAETLARYQASTTRQVSWDITIDTDGTVIQSNDFGLAYSWHASSANGWTIGIECVQHPDSGDLWATQLGSLVCVCEVICTALFIPRTVPVGAHGGPYSGVVKAWQEKGEGGQGKRFAGLVGHRNLTRNRGPGDPGDAVFETLLKGGFSGALVP
jgi:hypothetical protein